MGNTTSISWTHRTMNPIKVKDSKTFHCVKRSPACDNCYAEVMARRLAGMGHTKFYPYKVHREMPELELNRKMLADWSKTKKRYLNFVTSMTDIFGEFVPKEWIFDILDAMIAAPKQVFQCLTKREDIMMSTINEYCQLKDIEKLPLNIWMGITVESQKWYDKRLPYLLRSKVSIRWLSMEPLLGPVYLALDGTLPEEWGYGYRHVGDLLHWVIVGGESATPNKARPTHPDWFRSIRDQCNENNIPFFFKQIGCWASVEEPKGAAKGHYRFGKSQDGTDMPKFKEPTDNIISWLTEGESSQWVKYMPKKEAGAFLDGVEYKEFPVITERLLANNSI